MQVSDYEQNLKDYLSSDYRLKLIYMKEESLVIVNQHVAVKKFTNFVQTARQASRLGPF